MIASLLLLIMYSFPPGHFHFSIMLYFFPHNGENLHKHLQNL